MVIATCSWSEFSDTFCLTEAPAWISISLSVFFFSLSLIALIDSSRSLLTSLERLCALYDISEDVAGATVLAFGGSVPELLVNLIATARGQADLGASAIVGSGFIAYLLIPGVIIAFTERPLLVHKASVLRDSSVYLVALILVCSASTVNLYLSACLVLLYVFYLVYLLKHCHPDHAVKSEPMIVRRLLTDTEIGSEVLPLLEKDTSPPSEHGQGVLWSLTKIGMSSFVLSNMINFWTKVSGLEQGFLALVLVSLGAEIPDAVNAYTAATRGHGSMAMSACLGAQVVNVCVGMGVPWLLHGLIGADKIGSSLETAQSFSRIAEKLLVGVVLLGIIAVSAGINNKPDMNASRNLGVGLIFAYIVCVVCLGYRSIYW